MIYLGYLAEAKHKHFNNNIEKFLIVRSLQGNLPEGFTHLPHLSPSKELLIDALRWKEGNYTKAEEITCLRRGISPRNPDSWWVLYEPIFREELKVRDDVKIGIKMLKKSVRKGNEVHLFCYCKELDRCHRLLVGEYLEELGLEVNYGRKEKEEEIDESKNFQISMF